MNDPAKPDGITCKHNVQNSCTLSNRIAKTKVPTKPEICRLCTPENRDKLTNDRAIYTLYIAGKYKPQKKEPLVTEGVGTELAKSIKWFVRKNCGPCQRRMYTMNKWGPDKCEENIDTIKRWLKHSAAKARLPYSDKLVSILIRKAINKVRPPQPPPEPPPRTVEKLITWEDLSNDTNILTQIILENHPTLRGIAGVPRSGLKVATEIAIRLGVKVYEASREKGLVELNTGLRLKADPIHGPMTSFNGEIVLVEDSTCSGYSIANLRENPELKELPTYAVYGASPGKNHINDYAKHLELPHWFEWNIWNNGQILEDFNVAIDWDGVLNEDCTVEDDDDGERYINWLTNVKPIRTPRNYKVPFIITARREAYRNIAEEWLAKYHINYGQLIMFPGTFEERSQTDIGKWKAQEAMKVNSHMFIESCPIQAKTILDNSYLRVICTNL